MKRFERIRENCRDNWGWLLMLLMMDLLFALFLWLMDARSFHVLAGLWTVFSVILWCAAVLFLSRREGERERRIQNFLEKPDRGHEAEACSCVSGREKRVIQETGSRLREAERARKEQELALEDYEEYIESWAHEAKTPLALMTLMLDNRRDEMGEEVHHRLEYSRNQLQGYVEQILFYARMRAVHKDYLFEKVLLRDCCEEVMDQFGVFFMEHGFELVKDIPEVEVVTDRRSFCFLLGQVIANAVKYRKQDGTCPGLSLKAGTQGAEGQIFLKVTDNGAGVKACDLPFIFDKGFTGDTDGVRRKATGMGLYLVKQLSDNLKIEVEARSQYGEGFEMSFLFPFVH